MEEDNYKFINYVREISEHSLMQHAVAEGLKQAVSTINEKISSASNGIKSEITYAQTGLLTENKALKEKVSNLESDLKIVQKQVDTLSDLVKSIHKMVLYEYDRNLALRGMESLEMSVKADKKENS